MEDLRNRGFRNRYNENIQISLWFSEAHDEGTPAEQEEGGWTLCGVRGLIRSSEQKEDPGEAAVPECDAG